MELENNFYHIKSATGDQVIFTLDPEHVIYKAHFPGKPITPGACLLQMTVEFTEKLLGRPLQLKLIKEIKYLRTLEPVQGEMHSFIISQKEEKEGSLFVRASIQTEEQLVAKFNLVFDL